MEVHFSPEQEARLARLAPHAGTDPERLVKDAALRLLEDHADFGADPEVRRTKGELPSWQLGPAGPLHRRDLYDDAPCCSVFFACCPYRCTA
jgi:hypothetical protein